MTSEQYNKLKVGDEIVYLGESNSMVTHGKIYIVKHIAWDSFLIISDGGLFRNYWAHIEFFEPYINTEDIMKHINLINEKIRQAKWRARKDNEKKNRKEKRSPARNKNTNREKFYSPFIK